MNKKDDVYLLSKHLFVWKKIKVVGFTVLCSKGMKGKKVIFVARQTKRVSLRRKSPSEQKKKTVLK